MKTAAIAGPLLLLALVAPPLADDGPVENVVITGQRRAQNLDTLAGNTARMPSNPEASRAR